MALQCLLDSSLSQKHAQDTKHIVHDVLAPASNEAPMPSYGQKKSYSTFSIEFCHEQPALWAVLQPELGRLPCSLACGTAQWQYHHTCSLYRQCSRLYCKKLLRSAAAKAKQHTKQSTQLPPGDRYPFLTHPLNVHTLKIYVRPPTSPGSICPNNTSTPLHPGPHAWVLEDEASLRPPNWCGIEPHTWGGTKNFITPALHQQVVWYTKLSPS